MNFKFDSEIKFGGLIFGSHALKYRILLPYIRLIIALFSNLFDFTSLHFRLSVAICIEFEPLSAKNRTISRNAIYPELFLQTGQESVGTNTFRSCDGHYTC